MCFCARGLLWLWVLLWLALAPSASAHPNALSRADVYLGEVTRVELDLDGTSSVDLVARQLDLAQAPELEALAPHQERLVSYIDARFLLTADGKPCKRKDVGNLSFSRARNRLHLRLRYQCKPDSKRIGLESRLFSDESTPHQVMGGVHFGERYQRSLLEASKPVAFKLDALPLRESGPKGFRMATKPAASSTQAPAPPVATPSLEPPTEASGLSFSAFFLEGWRHILGGYDHLLFVFVLLLGAASLRQLAGWITLFTLAHSLSLVLSALELITISPRIVEPLIALSIVWVGIETLRGVTKHRGGVVFAFGLLHGLGFGSALLELGLSRHDIVKPLLGFNLGVELGQLTVVVPCFVLLLWQRKHHADWSHGIRTWTATGLSLVAALWFLQRLVA
ncbi:MAG: HupE/UreJ family protein [Polyangiaceae bacterium]